MNISRGASGMSGLQMPVRKRTKKWPFLLVGLIVVSTGAVAYNYSRPLPKPTITITLNTPTTGQPVNLTWPTEGTAAISADGYDFVAHKGDLDETFSAASMIKILTVLCVLEKHPLAAGESGPTLTMTAADVAMYDHEISRDGNHLKIVAGEQLSEYHALEAVLIESANNMTDTMAIWAFGSLEDYKTYALNFLKKHGMTHTQLGSDASGMDPATTSTLGDLITLAKLGFNNPIISKIIATPSATFTNGGTVINRNKLLGNGILLGGKTGSLDDIKGSYLFSATTKNISDLDIHMVGVVAYDSSVQGAIRDSEALAKSAASHFETVTLARAGDSVGSLSSDWGQRVPITLTKDLAITRWRGSDITLSQNLKDVSGQSTEEVGTITAQTDGKKTEAPLLVDQPLPPPSLLWRATRKP